jgi:DNA-binding IclR family transcriptional regulator
MNDKKSQLFWREVLAQLYRQSQFIRLEELTKLADLEEPAVMNALNFLAQQGWAECQEAGSEWACTAQARAIMDRLDHEVLRPV